MVYYPWNTDDELGWIELNDAAAAADNDAMVNSTRANNPNILDKFLHFVYRCGRKLLGCVISLLKIVT